jgi:TonB family protein
LAAAEPASDFSATIMDLYAQFLTQQGRSDEAQSLRLQASEIRKAQIARAPGTKSPSPDVKRIGGEVKAPVLISKTEPKYTAEARLAKYQGTILVYLKVDTEGLPRDVKVLRGLGLGLDQRAIDAISQWRFKPAMQAGQPVPVEAHVEVNFRLL